tara:strand:- start:21758 stop:22225 length:468 start_codon:yes stop_codon:yes gene_type:complete
MSDNLGTSIIRNVTLNYVKVDPSNPTDPFGTLQWECQIVVGSDRAEELAGFGSVKPVKDDPTRVAVNLKRKALRKDGTDNDPVQMVDGRKQKIDPTIKIGNGSIGNVKVYRREYDVAGRQGISTILSAIQVTKLIEYTGSVDFDIDDTEADDSEF